MHEYFTLQNCVVRNHQWTLNANIIFLPFLFLALLNWIWHTHEAATTTLTGRLVDGAGGHNIYL